MKNFICSLVLGILFPVGLWSDDARAPQVDATWSCDELIEALNYDQTSASAEKALIQKKLSIEAQFSQVKCAIGRIAALESILKKEKKYWDLVRPLAKSSSACDRILQSYVSLESWQNQSDSREALLVQHCGHSRIPDYSEVGTALVECVQSVNEIEKAAADALKIKVDVIQVQYPNSLAHCLPVAEEVLGAPCKPGDETQQKPIPVKYVDFMRAVSQDLKPEVKTAAQAGAKEADKKRSQDFTANPDSKEQGVDTLHASSNDGPMKSEKQKKEILKKLFAQIQKPVPKPAAASGATQTVIEEAHHSPYTEIRSRAEWNNDVIATLSSGGDPDQAFAGKWTDFLTQTEALDANMSLGEYQALRESWDEKFKTMESDIKAAPNSDAKVEALRKDLFQNYFSNYDKNANGIFDLLKIHGANDNARSKLVLSALDRAGQILGPDQKLGLQKYKDGYRPVLVTEKAGPDGPVPTVWDLVSGEKIEDTVTSPIYRPSRLLLDYLDAQNLKLPSTAKKLVLQDTTKKGKALESVQQTAEKQLSEVDKLKKGAGGAASLEDIKKSPGLGMAIFGLLASAGKNIADVAKIALAAVKSGLDLSGLDLSKTDLSKIDFSKLDISKIDFSKLDLSKLDLSKIDLSKVDLSHLDLSKMQLDKLLKTAGVSDLSKVDLSKVCKVDPDLVKDILASPVLADAASLEKHSTKEMQSYEPSTTANFDSKVSSQNKDFATQAQSEKNPDFSIQAPSHTSDREEVERVVAEHQKEEDERLRKAKNYQEKSAIADAENKRAKEDAEKMLASDPNELWVSYTRKGVSYDHRDIIDETAFVTKPGIEGMNGKKNNDLEKHKTLQDVKVSVGSTLEAYVVEAYPVQKSFILEKGSIKFAKQADADAWKAIHFNYQREAFLSRLSREDFEQNVKNTGFLSLDKFFTDPASIDWKKDDAWRNSLAQKSSSAFSSPKSIYAKQKNDLLIEYTGRDSKILVSPEEDDFPDVIAKVQDIYGKARDFKRRVAADPLSILETAKAMDSKERSNFFWFLYDIGVMAPQTKETNLSSFWRLNYDHTFKTVSDEDAWLDANVSTELKKALLDPDKVEIIPIQRKGQAEAVQVDKQTGRRIRDSKVNPSPVQLNAERPSRFVLGIKDGRGLFEPLKNKVKGKLKLSEDDFLDLYRRQNYSDSIPGTTDTNAERSAEYAKYSDIETLSSRWSPGMSQLMIKEIRSSRDSNSIFISRHMLRNRHVISAGRPKESAVYPSLSGERVPRDLAELEFRLLQADIDGLDPADLASLFKMSVGEFIDQRLDLVDKPDAEHSPYRKMTVRQYMGFLRSSLDRPNQ